MDLLPRAEADAECDECEAGRAAPLVPLGNMPTTDCDADADADDSRADDGLDLDLRFAPPLPVRSYECDVTSVPHLG